jgi:hypothetical protein
MKRTIHVIFDGEVFRPMEPLDLDSGHYRVTIEPVTSANNKPEEVPTLLERIAAMAQDLNLPPDYAEQVDHYLYGTPKR